MDNPIFTGVHLACLGFVGRILRWKLATKGATLMKLQRFHGAVVLLLGIGLIAGGSSVWASTKKDKPKVAAERNPAQEAQRLQREVRHELLMLPYYSVFDFLFFKVEGNRVELSGYVTRPTLKKEAENVVKDIEGVQDVVNKIVELPASPNDDRLRLALFRAIYGHDALQTYAVRALPPIHIIVNNGNVTLEGVVAREMEKNIANLQANGVPGIFSVTNRLVVEEAK
jgi:hyperosmotically inducible periplasmic protein